MKKIILSFAVCFSIVAANAQVTTSVDAHAGHNHAKETVVANPKKIATVQPVAAIAATETPVPADALGLKETEFDFGKIPQGKPVTHVFTVSNTGKTPFKLDNVQASCGCTTPDWDREKMIEPGASAKITVGFNAGSVSPFTKPVTITYNGTQTKVITIKGEVYATPAVAAPANTEIIDIKK